jgi:DNA ligase-1
MMIKPMLAQKVNKKPIDWDEDIFMQPKLDGVRCIIQLDDSGKTMAYSRTGKPWKNIEHILTDLQPWFDFHPDVILDGELYNHDLRDNFEKIISLVRKQKPTDQDKLEAKELVQFHCYDYANGNDLYSTRMNNLNTTEMYSYCVIHVPTKVVFHQKLSEQLHKQNLEAGYEGSILRLDRLYQCKRSYGLQKFKDFSDKEAFIVGYEEGKGKREGTLGKFFMQDDEGVEFGCPPGKGYNYGALADILNNIGDYMGKRATFTYFERTKSGNYRHPMFKTLRNYE